MRASKAIQVKAPTWTPGGNVRSNFADSDIWTVGWMSMPQTRTSQIRRRSTKALRSHRSRFNPRRFALRWPGASDVAMDEVRRVMDVEFPIGERTRPLVVPPASGLAC